MKLRDWAFRWPVPGCSLVAFYLLTLHCNESSCRTWALRYSLPPSTRSHQLQRARVLLQASCASEPAGVVRLFSRPQSIRKSIRERKKQAGNLLRQGSQRMSRRKSKQHEYMLDDLVQSGRALEELSLPSWASQNSEELRNLAVMKALLKSELKALESQTIQNEGGHFQSLTDAFPDVYGDFRLLRFLRKDKVQNPLSAARRFSNFLQWRDECSVDQVRQRVEKHPFSPPRHLNLIGDLFPNDFDVREHTTCSDTIAVILNVGNWDTPTLAHLIRRKEIPVFDFLQYWTYVYESLNRKLYAVSMERQQMVYVDAVTDLFDLNVNQFSPWLLSSVVKPWITLTQSNYPQTSKRIFFLRPPRILSAIWNMVAPMANPTTVAKIQFHRDYKGSCHEFVRERRIEAVR